MDQNKSDSSIIGLGVCLGRQRWLDLDTLTVCDEDGGFSLDSASPADVEKIAACLSTSDLVRVIGTVLRRLRA